MNKKYIKRQLTLHDLGLPISEDIKEYYTYFQQMIGDKNNLEELRHDDCPNSIFWRKEGNIILEYEIKKERFWVNYDTFWLKFEEKFDINFNDINKLLSILLEDTFKLRVTITYKENFTQGKRWGEAFKLKKYEQKIH